MQTLSCASTALMQHATRLRQYEVLYMRLSGDADPVAYREPNIDVKCHNISYFCIFASFKVDYFGNFYLFHHCRIHSSNLKIEIFPGALRPRPPPHSLAYALRAARSQESGAIWARYARSSDKRPPQPE